MGWDHHRASSLAVSDAPSAVTGKHIENGREHALLLQIKPAGDQVDCQARFDGKLFYSWRGKQKQLSTYWRFDLRQPGIGFGAWEPQGVTDAR